jgi:hypothetical protein
MEGCYKIGTLASLTLSCTIFSTGPYTGVTRGKRLVIVIGEPKAIAMAAKNVSQRKRITKLAQRLHDGMDERSIVSVP